MNPQKKTEVDKINVEDLLQVFKDINQDAFILYLKSIWKDLAQRSESKDKGINKITFIQYYILPGIISDRLFAVFDEDKNGFLSLQEFYDGMMTLFTKPFEELSYFIFKLYDADSDGSISKDDIKSLMQYISIDSNILGHVNQINPNIKFQDRVDSQKELTDKLEIIFGKDKTLDYKKFKAIIEEKNSDVYLFILIFIMENRPFKKQTIEMYLGCLKSVSKSPTQTQSKLIASPTMTSKFSPSNFLSNSPCMKQKKLKEKNGLNLFEKYTGKPTDKKDNLIKLIGGEEKTEKTSTQTQDLTSVGPIRKNVAFLKNLEKDTVKAKKDHDENDPIYNLHEARKYEGQGGLIGNDKKQVDDDDDDEDDKSPIQYEGYIYKITESNKLKKLWFKLFDKDLFCKHI